MDVDLSGNYAYVADAQKGLSIFQLEYPTKQGIR